MAAPVTNRAWSLHRNAANAPKSSGRPTAPTGVAAAKSGAIYVTSDIDNIVYRLTPAP